MESLQTIGLTLLLMLLFVLLVSGFFALGTWAIQWARRRRKRN